MKVQLITILFISALSMPIFSQNNDKIVMRDIVESELSMSATSIDDMKWVTLTNKNGINNLESYPNRPEYQFPGNEVIYKLPKMGGSYYFYVNERVPDIELDIFVLTDPTDAQSAVMWMNGTGAKQLMQANPNQDYYLVADGFKGNVASIQFAIAPTSGIPEFCFNAPIILKDLRTLDPTSIDIQYRRLSGTGGVFDTIPGVFTPDHLTTTSIFEITTNKNTPPATVTENVTLFFKDCSIPTLGQWGIIVLALFLMIFGILAIKVVPSH